MFPLSNLPKNESLNLLNRLSLCVNGTLSESITAFFQSMLKTNPTGLEKLLDKLQQLEVQLSSDQFEQIFRTLKLQLKLPKDILQTIHSFLGEKINKTLFLDLVALPHPKSKLQQSVLYMMDQLHIFCKDNHEDQFIRLMIQVLIRWKEEQRPLKEAVKWLESILGITQHPDMTKILHLLTSYFHLRDAIIPGKSRNLDGLDILFLLENLFTEQSLMGKSNKKFIADLQATFIILMICQATPHAFYDVMAKQNVLRPVITPRLLNGFFNHSHFKRYFNQPRAHELNQEAFFAALTKYMEMAIEVSALENDLDVADLLAFIKHCRSQRSFMSTAEDVIWIKKTLRALKVQPRLFSSLLKKVQSQASAQKAFHVGRIRAAALQLVALGFSHRSSSAMAKGNFQPLVHTDTSSLDLHNIQVLVDFFDAQTLEDQNSIAEELLALSVLHRHMPIENPQDPLTLIPKPAPVLKKLKNAHPQSIIPKVIRSGPNHRARLFALKTRIDALSNVNADLYQTFNKL